MKKQIILVAAILLLGFSIASAQIPKTISGGVLNGKAQNLPIPEYPAAAKAVKAGGEVKVQVTIDENGSVTEASAVSGHPLLRSAAEDAARQAKFTPTQLSGQAVKVTGVIVYNFTPSQAFVTGDVPVRGPARIMSDGAATEQSLSNSSGKTISGGVVNGKARNLVAPAYPAAAKAVNASGEVKVQVTIDENGDVVSANAVSGHPLLRAASEKAARESKFSPTILQGQPVKVTGIIIYNFLMPMPWVQIGYELSLAEKSLLFKSYPISSVAGSFPADWSEEKGDLEKIRLHLAEKSIKEKSQQKQSEQTNTDSSKSAPPKGAFILGDRNISKDTLIIGDRGISNETQQLDEYSTGILNELQSKIDNRLYVNTNKFLYFKFGKSLGKLVAEIDDDYKTSINSQELNQLVAANSSNVSDSFVTNIKNIIEISTQNISVSDKKEKMLAMIKRLQDY